MTQFYLNVIDVISRYLDIIFTYILIVIPVMISQQTNKKLSCTRSCSTNIVWIDASLHCNSISLFYCVSLFTIPTCALCRLMMTWIDLMRILSSTVMTPITAKFRLPWTQKSTVMLILHWITQLSLSSHIDAGKTPADIKYRQQLAAEWISPVPFLNTMDNRDHF